MFDSLLDLMRQTESLLGRFPVGAQSMAFATQGSNLVLRAQLDGIDPKSVRIQVTDSVLAIGGHASREERTETPDFYQMQSGFSQFYRELPLPAPVDPHGVTAKWQPDGSLVVTLPMR